MKTKSIEILDPASGLFVSLTSGGSGAIMLGEDVVAAAPIPAGGLDPLVDGAPLELETEHGELAVSIASTGEPISHQQMEFEDGRTADQCRVFVLRRDRDEQQ